MRLRAPPALRKIGSAILKSFGMSPVGDSRGGWWPWIREPFTGAWQKNKEWSVDTVLAFHAVYACVTLISSDIGKLRWKLMEAQSASDPGGLWNEVTSPAYSPVLKNPNTYQNHIQFKEWWETCKLLRGNAYGLKRRDNRGVVRHIYVLDPNRVTVLVSPSGEVFYRLSADNLSGLEEGSIEVPADEIIHDRMNCLFHPLVGVSPLFAAGLAATAGLNIQHNSETFFGNASQPGGVLTAPGAISDETARRLKTYWAENFTGDNAGKIAVAGDGLKFERLTMSATDAQMIEQLKWNAEVVCSCFKVPAYKIGVGTTPAAVNVEALDTMYYSQCLQILIEQFELCMDEGLGLNLPVVNSQGGRMMGVELDLDGLLRMDSATQVTSLVTGVNGGIYAPNEARRRMNLKPLKGGDTIYLQQQQYSIQALAERDADKPFSKPPSGASGSGGAPSGGNAPPPPNDDEGQEEERSLDSLIKRLDTYTVGIAA